VGSEAGLGDPACIDAGLGERAIAAFNARHLTEYGHIREGEVPETTGVRLVTSVETPLPPARGGFTAPATTPAPLKTRRANLGEGFNETPVYSGVLLAAGSAITGPAIIEETFTTIVVYPGWEAVMDDAGDCELRRA
jgi:N-methylhydantoinase A